MAKTAALAAVPPQGSRSASLAALAAAATFTPTRVCRYGQTTTVHTATGSWRSYGVFGARRSSSSATAPHPPAATTPWP